MNEKYKEMGADNNVPYKGASSKMSATDAVLTERGERYGKFKDVATVTETLSSVITAFSGTLSDSQKCALYMMCHKMARIACGDPNYDDNWLDISGYAMLVHKQLNGENP